MTAAGLLRQAAETITRDGARDAARDELSDPAYRISEPSLADRFFSWIGDFVSGPLGNVAGLADSGWGVLVLLGVVALVVALIKRGAGPLRGRNALLDRRRGSASITAAEYRAESERLFAAGQWKEAVRARFRATVRELEERAVLDPRPGRTAGEVATEAGALVPAVSADLRGAAEIFNAVWYGGTQATPELYVELRRIDDNVRGARLTVLAT